MGCCMSAPKEPEVELAMPSTTWLNLNPLYIMEHTTTTDDVVSIATTDSYIEVEPDSDPETQVEA